MNHNVPIQSLIDHINSAIDVDPWAKEMAEELLKRQEPIKPKTACDGATPFPAWWYVCGNCGNPINHENFCNRCGQAVKWE